MENQTKPSKVDAVFKLDKNTEPPKINAVIKEDEGETFEGKVANSISGAKVNNLIKIMILMGQRGVRHAHQSFENEVAIDKLHTISYDNTKGIGRILDVNDSRIFDDKKYYNFKKVKEILDKYFFTLDYAKV